MTGRLVLVDALTMEMHVVRLPKDPKCPVCSVREGDFAHLAVG